MKRGTPWLALAAGTVLVLVFSRRAQASGSFAPYADIICFDKRGDGAALSLKDWVRPLEVAEAASTIFVSGELATDIHNGWNTIITSLTYLPEMEVDIWQYPLETWTSKLGDCEDGAFLLTSLLLNGTAQVWNVIGVFEYDGSAMGHAWTVAEANGQRCILETTLDTAIEEGVWMTETEGAENYKPYIYFNSNSITAIPNFTSFGFTGSRRIIAGADKRAIINDVWRRMGKI